MSVAAAHASAFYREVAEYKVMWTMQGDAGVPVIKNGANWSGTEMQGYDIEVDQLIENVRAPGVKKARQSWWARWLDRQDAVK